MYIIKVEMQKFSNNFDSVVIYNLIKTDENGKISTNTKKYVFPKEKSKFLKSVEDIFGDINSSPENIGRLDFFKKIINYVINLNRSVELNYDKINNYFSSVLEENVDYNSFINGESNLSYISQISEKNIEDYKLAIEDGRVVNRALTETEETTEVGGAYYDPEEEFDEGLFEDEDNFDYF